LEITHKLFYQTTLFTHMKQNFSQQEVLSASDLQSTQGGTTTKRVTYRQCGSAYVKVAKQQTINFTNDQGVEMTLTVNANNTFTVTSPTEVFNMKMVG
jgi:uncharacterized lipoprotein NlpE involved in copper resistance